MHIEETKTKIQVLIPDNQKKNCTQIAVLKISCLLPWQLLITQRHPASNSKGRRGGREEYGKQLTGKG